MGSKTVLKNEKSSMGRKSLSSLSVIIPCEPGGDPGACLDALRALGPQEKGLIKEVLVAWGRHPSLQRNLAVLKARSPWVLFLDADSRVQPGALSALLAAASQPQVAAAGGPNLPLPNEPPLGLAFDRVLASFAGSMRSRARYAPVGRRRPCGEKELILCNLLVRREAFVAAGGFREDLYPNEENELFNRLQADGWELVYEPAAQVRRPRRDTVAAFVAQAFRYGRGRTQQMRRNFFPSDLVNLLPLALPLAWALVLASALHVSHAWALPLLYAAGCWLAMGMRVPSAFFLALRHHAYAAGLLTGFFQDAPGRDRQVRLQAVALRRKGRR